jgi:alkaline phosphatase/alkaline phosphatase D
LLSGVAAGLIRASNNHVKWTELDGHGYCVLDVTAGACRMDWYHLANRTSRTSTARWVNGWSVPAGSSRLRRHAGPSA